MFLQFTCQTRILWNDPVCLLCESAASLSAKIVKGTHKVGFVMGFGWLLYLYDPCCTAQIHCVFVNVNNGSNTQLAPAVAPRRRATQAKDVCAVAVANGFSAKRILPSEIVQDLQPQASLLYHVQ